MHQWLNARCAKLLEELNNTPYTDDADEIKLKLIRSAMREASVEMFHRAADNSRKAIDKINKQCLNEAIKEVEDAFDEIEKTPPKLKTSSIKPAAEPAPEPQAQAAPSPAPEAPVESKPKPKIQISSSVIRRTD